MTLRGSDLVPSHLPHPPRLSWFLPLTSQARVGRGGAGQGRAGRWVSISKGEFRGRILEFLLQVQAGMRGQLGKFLVFQLLPNSCDQGEGCARRGKSPASAPSSATPVTSGLALSASLHVPGDLRLFHPTPSTRGSQGNPLFLPPLLPSSHWLLLQDFFHLVFSTRLDSSPKHSPRPWDPVGVVIQLFAALLLAPAPWTPAWLSWVSGP